MAKTTEYTATVYEQEKTIIKYKIVGFWEITDSDDGFADDTVECFGDMKINGVTYWSIPSGAAQGYDRASGGRIDLKAPSGGDIILTVDLLSKVPNPTVMEFAGILMDWDRSSGDDELGTCNQKVDIRALAQNGQELILTQGNLSQARFHLRVVEAN